MKYFPIALVAALFFLGSCKGGKKDEAKSKQQPPPLVDVIIAKAQSISNNIEVNGTVVAQDFTELHPEISGIVTSDL